MGVKWQEKTSSIGLGVSRPFYSGADMRKICAVPGYHAHRRQYTTKGTGISYWQKLDNQDSFWVILAGKLLEQNKDLACVRQKGRYIRTMYSLLHTGLTFIGCIKATSCRPVARFWLSDSRHRALQRSWYIRLNTAILSHIYIYIYVCVLFYRERETKTLWKTSHIQYCPQYSRRPGFFNKPQQFKLIKGCLASVCRIFGMKRKI